MQIMQIQYVFAKIIQLAYTYIIITNKTNINIK